MCICVYMYMCIYHVVYTQANPKLSGPETGELKWVG